MIQGNQSGLLSNFCGFLTMYLYASYNWHVLDLRVVEEFFTIFNRAMYQNQFQITFLFTAYLKIRKTINIYGEID